MNLYRLEFQGYRIDPAYILAESTNEAYDLARKDLDDRDYAYRKDRGLKTISLVAQDTECPDCGTRLYVTEVE